MYLLLLPQDDPSLCHDEGGLCLAVLSLRVMKGTKVVPNLHILSESSSKQDIITLYLMSKTVSYLQVCLSLLKVEE